jgi:hypothetical protein
MEQITAQPTMTAGAASYPPAYDKPGPTLDRGYRNYIRARMNRDATGADVARSWVEASISAVGRGA